MNLAQIVTGVVSGYASRLIQLVASLVIVPFLLDSAILGVEDYGRAFSILGAMSIVGIVVAGFHLAADRAIARAVGGADGSTRSRVGELLGAATKLLLIASLAFVVPLVFFEGALLEALGIPSDGSHRGAVLAAGAIVVGENAFYLLRTPLIARGDIAYVGWIGMFEVAARTLATFLLFASGEGSVVLLLGLQALFTFLRQILLFLRISPEDRAGWLGAPLSSVREMLREAGPISLAEGSIILVRTAPVVVASRYLGAVEAGYVAVVSNTLQGYFLQIFYSVVHPIAVPIASRFSMAEPTEARRRALADLESAYAFGVAVVFGQVLFWMPVLIPLWLGRELAPIVPATQLMLAGSGVQTGAIIRRAILIGQGVIAEGVPAIVASALLATVGIVVGVVAFESWNAAIVSGAGYLVASSVFGVDRIFAPRFARDGAATAGRRLVALVGIHGICMLVSTRASLDAPLASMGWSLVALAGSLAFGFATILSLARTRALIERLYRSRGVQLFE